MKRDFFFVFALFFVALAMGVSTALASTTNGAIPAASYAWGENFGWINFGCDNCGIIVTDSTVTGDAWSNQYGWINLSPTNGGVTNDGNGNLGGNAWSSGLGWISFSGVTINSSGQFTGVAGVQGSTAGRINFSCDNCGVTTDWRPASVRNQNSGSNNSSGNSSGGSVSSSGSFLPGFLNLFNNNPFGNANASSANENTVNGAGSGGANSPYPGANNGQSQNSGGIGTLPGYSFASSTRPLSTASGTHVPNQPLTNAGSSWPSVFSPLLLGIASVILLMVILILRFFL